MSERDRRQERVGQRAAVDRQDATGLDVPAGRPAPEVPREEVRPAVVEGDEEGGRRSARAEDDEGRVVATVHADPTPAREERGVRPIGNTDVPVNARDPDAP